MAHLCSVNNLRSRHWELGKAREKGVPHPTISHARLVGGGVVVGV
jgi:hypothetical protein